MAAAGTCGAGSPKRHLGAAHTDASVRAVEALAGHPATGTFLHDEAPGLADIVLVPQLYNARRWGVALDDMPRLVAVEEACLSLPAFAAAAPEAVRPADG